VTILAGTARRMGLQVAAFRYLQVYAQVSKGPVRVLAKLKEVYPQSTRCGTGPSPFQRLCAAVLTLLGQRVGWVGRGVSLRPRRKRSLR
jgi:hypothetical protein